jgi:hypothetical protein
MKASMKTTILFFSLILVLSTQSCQKNDSKEIYGIYIGQNTTINSGVKEVFTSPTTSEIVAFSDTIVQLDTIEIIELSADSFAIDPFPCLVAFFNGPRATDDTLFHALSIGNGYITEECKMIFTSDTDRFYYKGNTYNQGFGTWTKSDFVFEGKLE